MMKKKFEKCTHIERVSLHPSVKVGGFCIGGCENEAVPGLNVCLRHAHTESMLYCIQSLLKDIEKWKKKLKRLKGKAK
jgi:hypothetical protein